MNQKILFLSVRLKVVRGFLTIVLHKIFNEFDFIRENQVFQTDQSMEF